MKRIVVGTDLTARSGAAVRMAADLAESTGATLHIVTACAPPTVGTGPDMVVVPDHKGLIDSSRTDIDAIAADIERRGIPTEAHVCVGDAAGVLCEVAETVDADCIVVGNKRMKGAARILGSVPNKVAHRADCSVLIARTGD